MRPRGRHQPHRPPSRLRRGRLTLAFERRVLIRIARFAKRPVEFLDAAEPVGGAADVVAVHALADGSQTREDLPGAVDVVDAPAAEPAAFGFLAVADEFDGFAD